MEQKPSVGRIVHYHSAQGSDPEAALVLAVHSDVSVNLQTWNANGTGSTRTSITFEGVAEGAPFWRWPPRA